MRATNEKGSTRCDCDGTKCRGAEACDACRELDLADLRARVGLSNLFLWALLGDVARSRP